MIGPAVRVMPTWAVTARRRVLVATASTGHPVAQHRTVFAGATYVLDGFSGRGYVPKTRREWFPDARPARGWAP